MKTTTTLVGAPGASTNQKTIASSFPFSMRSLAILGILLPLVLMNFSAFSQTYDTLDVALFQTEIVSQSGTLMAGETATIYFHLGTKTGPVSRAVAFDIELDLGANTVLPVTPEFGIGNSWMLAPTSTDKSELSDTVSHSIRLVAERADSVAQSGYGEVFSDHAGSRK